MLREYSDIEKITEATLSILGVVMQIKNVFNLVQQNIYENRCTFG